MLSFYRRKDRRAHGLLAWTTSGRWTATTGLNTGGMGTVAPNPYYTPEVAEPLHGGDLPAHRRAPCRPRAAPSRAAFTSA